MIVFAVSQLRSYYDCGEQYFGTEGIFLTYDEAKKFINQEIDDIISGFNRDDHEIFFGLNDEFDDEVSWDDDSISSDGHKFQWDISPVTLKNPVTSKVFETIQHENDIEDIKNTIEVEDDLLYDHIRDISIDTMNRMAYLKREKEDNGMAWNDAASAAFHEVINQQ